MESSKKNHNIYNCTICGIKTRGRKAICFCPICNDYLCTFCEVSHRFQKGKQNHEVIDGFPIVLKRDSSRPITRNSRRTIKHQTEYKGNSQRRRLAHKQVHTKDSTNTMYTNRVKKRKCMDANDTANDATDLKPNFAPELTCTKSEFVEIIPIASKRFDDVIKTCDTMRSPRSRKLVSEMGVVSKREVDIRFPGETCHPCISCCVFMPSGELVIGDQNNKVLKFLDNTLVPRDSIKLPGRPFNYLAVTSDTSVLIALNDLLQFVQALPKPELKHAIQLEDLCRGLAVANRLIYVIIRGENKIRVLDYHGKCLRFVTDNLGTELSSQKPVSIAINNNIGKLYVSEWLEKGVLHCFSSNGNMVYRYVDDELKYGACIYMDGDDDILLFGHKKENVFIIDKTGTKGKTIFTRSDGLYVPRCMAFRAADKTFVIGGYTEKLLVFNMK